MKFRPGETRGSLHGYLARYVAGTQTLKALWRILTEDVCLNCMEGSTNGASSLDGQTASIAPKQHIYRQKQYHRRNKRPTISHANAFDCITIKCHDGLPCYCRIGLCRLRNIVRLDLCHVVILSVNDIHEDLRSLTVIIGKRCKSSNTVPGRICNPIVRKIRQC
jgi:hypothetical protein